MRGIVAVIQMFGLPLSTTFLVFGFPLFWVAYTIGFLYVSRNWTDEAGGQDDA